MRGSKIAFILLFTNLLLMYLNLTMQLTTASVGVIMLFLNIPLVILLFLVRENILEFLKYMVYLVLMSIVYHYIEPYITYRSEAHLKKMALIQKYQERCFQNITNEEKLKESLELWERDYKVEENIELSLMGASKFKVILFFMDKNNTIDEMKIDENMSALKKVNMELKKIVRKHDVEGAIKDILMLEKEERVIYSVDNICYLSQKYELMEDVKKEEYKKREVKEFLLETCEGMDTNKK